jgi:hypothetical protein
MARKIVDVVTYLFTLAEMASDRGRPAAAGGRL